MALTRQAAAVNTVGHSDEHAAHDPRCGSRAAILRCGLGQGRALIWAESYWRCLGSYRPHRLLAVGRHRLPR
jgi:hypothetical protein